jgi:hypothetical protein
MEIVFNQLWPRLEIPTKLLETQIGSKAVSENLIRTSSGPVNEASRAVQLSYVIGRGAHYSPRESSARCLFCANHVRRPCGVRQTEGKLEDELNGRSRRESAFIYENDRTFFALEVPPRPKGRTMRQHKRQQQRGGGEYFILAFLAYASLSTNSGSLF